MFGQHRPSETCAKCGTSPCRVEYNRTSDMLDYTCLMCGYTWSAAPLDKRPGQPKRGGYIRQPRRGDPNLGDPVLCMPLARAVHSIEPGWRVQHIST